MSFVKVSAIAGVLTVLFSTPPGLCQDRPANDLVVYSPDVLGVDRLFMIVLSVPIDSPQLEVAVSPPDVATLFDRTPLPAKADERRYYFRTLKPARKAKVTLAHPEGNLTVPIEIWSFDDLREFRKLKGTQLPRRWPLGEVLPELKEARTITTQAELDAAKTSGPGRGAHWLKKSDDEIWAMQPDSTIPRWHWVNVTHGCPIHGTEIYKSKAFYPWGKDASLPYRWKIECPVGHEFYPSNDFAAGDMTSGNFPDDGFGGACPHDGKRYGFIAEICQAYCHEMLKVAPDCADAYLATGDVRYLHKSLVAFSRLAVEWSYLATMTQHRHRNSRKQVDRLGPAPFSEGPYLARSGFTVYPIDLPGYQWRYAEAYDKIFPNIGEDPEIIPYLQSKGYSVKTHEDVRRFIEENLFAVWMQGSIDLATASNAPYHQRGLARMAEMLNYRRGDEFMEWLYDGAGEMRIFVPNTYFRDGAPYESTGGYNGMHVTALGPIVESVEHLRQMRPEVYPEQRFPSLSRSRRYHNVFDFCMDTLLIDRSYPLIGDSGSFPAYKRLPKVTWHSASPEAFEHAYRLFRDPKFAWALANSSWQPSRNFPFTREEIEAEAARWPDDWNNASSIHDGYGVAILRSGQDDDKRAFWLRYGRARGHVQDDLMDIGLQAYEGVFLSHMGYPRNWGYWEHSWSSHNVARQFPYVDQVAEAEFLVDCGAAHVAEVRAEPNTSFRQDGARTPAPADYWQQRTLALVDVSPRESYCVDFYRISGGEEHWWAFHGQEGEVSTHGIQLTRQKKGTLAGTEVPYGDTGWLKANGCSLHPTYGWRGVKFVFPHLYNVERGRTEHPWWIDWKFRGNDDIHLRLTVVDAVGGNKPLQVNIADGTSPAGGNPYEMKWVMLQNSGDTPARTHVFSILEPYQKQPIIREARKLGLSGQPPSEATACQLQLADRIDTIFCTSDPTIEHTAAGGFRFAGRFGLYAEKDGKPVSMSLIGGTLLEKGDYGINLENPEFRGRIVAVDRRAETIMISPAPASLDQPGGSVVFLTNQKRRIACKVVKAVRTGDTALLKLDMDSRIGVGKVTGTDDFLVSTDTPFILQGYGYYDGARLVNADGTAEYRVNQIRSGRNVMIDRRVHPEARSERLTAEFPKQSWFEVYDYGVGDEISWPYSVSVTFEHDGSHRVESSAPSDEVTLRAPQ